MRLGNFQYFIVCESTSRREDDRYTLRDVTEKITVAPSEDVDLCWQFCALIEPSMNGKFLEIRQHTQSLTDRTQDQLIARAEIQQERKRPVSPWFYSQRFLYRPSASTFLVLQVVDVDGSFGPPDSILSTFKVFVKINKNA